METTEKLTDAGYLAKVDLENTTVLNIFTKAGNYRGGKTYFQDKIFLILSGETEVTTFDGEADVVHTYDSSHGLIKIPAGTPNIFYFPEDTEMLEWFPKDTKSEKFERYRTMK